jgi:hypothetical protein
MATTLNKIAYKALNRIRPELSDDEAIDIRQLKDEVIALRALFIRNEQNKNRSIDQHIEQTLCATLEVADRSVCTAVPVGCSILRTDRQIPNPIELHFSDGITDVGSIDNLEIPFSYIPYKRVRYAGNGRYNKETVFAFLFDDRMYFFSKENTLHKYMTHARITGVFEDPREVGDFQFTDSSSCYTDDSTFPVNRWMEDYIVNALVERYIPTIQLPVDPTNDGTHNLGQQ